MRRERFLGEASRILAESLDCERTLKTVARLAVPEIADWCIIDLIGDAGTLVRMATEHRDPNLAPLAAALHHNTQQRDAVSGPPNVIRTGLTEYVPKSTICAPLVARDRILGAITLATAIGRELTLEDVGMAEDLARRASFAIDNARLYDEAQRAIRAREEVLAIVTHDLRTPLSVVTTGASLLISMDSVSPDANRIKQRGETIERAALHMSRLIKDLTDLAQIDAGRLAVDKTGEDPAEVVKEVIDALEPVVSRRGGALHAEEDADVPRTPLDRDRVRQVLANLVGNANKVGASAISIGMELRGADVNSAGGSPTNVRPLLSPAGDRIQGLGARPPDFERHRESSRRPHVDREHRRHRQHVLFLDNARINQLRLPDNDGVAQHVHTRTRRLGT